jgi:hypothetical protein
MVKMDLLLQFTVVLFSLLAGGFWLASATGRTMEFLPWRPVKDVQPSELVTHQAKWNARAAMCAAVSAIAQAIIFLLQNPLLH